MWIHDRVRQFTVYKLSSFLINEGMEVNDFPSEKIWKLKVPSRVHNFFWMMAIECITTKDFSISRGVRLDL